MFFADTLYFYSALRSKRQH